MRQQIDGQPVCEMVTEVEIETCVVCGHEALSDEGGSLENLRFEDGVLRGDATCSRCLSEENQIELEKLKGATNG